MADEAWARQEGESAKWYARFLIYRNMPATDRSLLAAVNEWLILKKIEEIQARQLPVEEATALLRDIEGQIRPYKNAPGAWRRTAEKWRWKERAEAHDAKLQTEREERECALRALEQAKIEEIMTTGYAAKHERVRALGDMARTIEKSFRKPDSDEIVYQWLTPDKVREWRGCLEDIAKILGERDSKGKLSLKSDGPIEFETEWGGGMLPDEDESES